MHSNGLLICLAPRPTGKRRSLHNSRDPSSYRQRKQFGFKESSTKRRREKNVKREINIVVPQNLVLFSLLLKRLL